MVDRGRHPTREPPMLSWWRSRSNNDDGAILVLFALLAIVLFGFMAIAVDSAHAFTQRRSSQYAADVSAVGGAIQVIDHNGTQTQKATDLIDKVIEMAQSNLGPGLDWATCTDAEAFAESGLDYFTSGDSQYTQCVSWESDFSKVRVKIPDRDINTFFAQVIGFDTITVGAFAEVEAIVGGGGGVLPFGLLGGVSNGLVCLKTGPQSPDECEPNVSGNFGFLDFRIYGNTTMGTVSTGCTGATVTTLKENIAHGIDHDLTELEPLSNWPSLSSPEPTHQEISNDTTVIKDDVQCPDNSKAVHAALTETGNKQKVIIDGFINGINGFPGRLAVGNPSRVLDYYGVDVDDVGLWEYLLPTIDLGSGPNANPCLTETTEALIIACVNTYSGVVLFKDSIATSSRLAKVPKIHQTTWPNGTKYVSFQSFRFVYLQTLFGGCGGGSCNLEFRPNETSTLTSDDPVVITAIVLPDGVISSTVRDSFGVIRVTTYAITR